MTAPVDFDLHGLVGIRLVEPSAADTRAVERQLGPLRAPLGREPDIVVRFVDRLETGRVTYLGVDDAGFTDDAFLILRSKHKARARVQIPLGALGDRVEIVCERGLPAVPLLIPIVNLTALANGALPLHASAFVADGCGIVVTGWSKGGKTEALLAFVARGARYVGDEWVYLSADGSRVYGIPEPIRVWDWHLAELPAYRARIGREERARLATLRAVRSVAASLPRSRSARRALPLVEGQLHVDLAPEALFGGAAQALEASFDRLIFVASHERDAIDVGPIDTDEVARRMAASLEYERLRFTGHYLQFRFAFPDSRSTLVERATEIERNRLASVLSGKPSFAVSHPYPVSLPALHAAMAPVCSCE